jgi:hypothetical protein
MQTLRHSENASYRTFESVPHPFRAASSRWSKREGCTRELSAGVGPRIQPPESGSFRSGEGYESTGGLGTDLFVKFSLAKN